MKFISLLAVILAMDFSMLAAPPTWEELSSHLFNNAAIVWQAPTNGLPKSLWIYERALPHVFSATVISNAIILGSLQSKGFPKPSTNDFYISEDKGANYPGPIPTIFGIIPGDASLYYSMPNYSKGSGKEIPDDKIIVKKAWQCAAQFGLDATNLIQERIYSQKCDANQDESAQIICGRGVFLTRQLDGIRFFSADNQGAGAEGFSIEFGSNGQIRSFLLHWSNVRRYKNQSVADDQEIIQCIKAHKIIVLPNLDETDFFGRLKTLAKIKTLTIDKITPYYAEALFQEGFTNDTPSKFATPFAELQGTADFGDSKMIVQFISPILSSEVKRVLQK